MRKPTYDPKGFVSRLQSLAKWSVLFAEHQNEAFETSVGNSTKRLVEAYRKQNEYIEYLEKELEQLKQPVNLYYISNGYQGYVPVSVEVIATNEKRALELASKAFKEDARNESYEKQLDEHKRFGWDLNDVEEYRYSSDYWEELTIDSVLEDVRGFPEHVGSVQS